jgi:hypothetical protein
MTDLVIYGASDDLVEVEGLVRDELNPPYDKPAVVTVKVDDTTYAQLHVEYDPDHSGEWRVQTTSAGQPVRVIDARHTDDGTWDEHGCPGYSDKAIIDMGEVEARRVNVGIEAA